MMPMFKNAIVRIPCRNIVDGLTSSDLGKPDFLKALGQHSGYIETLRKIGLKVTVLPENDLFPDSVFIEDVALCTSSFAVITNPGAESRRGETEGIKQVLKEFYDIIEEISAPGTLEAGDVMMVGNHFYIGISKRTSANGADQLIRILQEYGMEGSKIQLNHLLHLKSGVSYLENNTLLAYGELINSPEFAQFEKIEIGADESYAANSLYINGKVLVPEGFPGTREKIEKAGLETIVLDVSEFRKVDGGLSCLSLRF